MKGFNVIFVETKEKAPSFIKGGQGGFMKAGRACHSRENGNPAL